MQYDSGSDEDPVLLKYDKALFKTSFYSLGPLRSVSAHKESNYVNCIERKKGLTGLSQETIIIIIVSDYTMR